MIITGFEKFTVLDYPGKLSALIFTFGCNLSCPYCHNPELVVGKLKDLNRFTTTEIVEFMKTRRGQLDALSITGGEPTLHADLLDFMQEIKNLGFLVKLDTNGLSPEKVKTIIDAKVVDYWAMDIKGDEAIYSRCGFKKSAIDNLKESISLIMNSGVDYEFRTTSLKSWHTTEVYMKIGELITGAKNYYIQNFRPGKSINSKLNEAFSFTDAELESIQKLMKNYAVNVEIRA